MKLFGEKVQKVMGLDGKEHFEAANGIDVTSIVQGYESLRLRENHLNVCLCEKKR